MSSSIRIPASPLDLFNHIQGYKGANQEINTITKLSGRIDENLLRKALKLAINEDPILGCRLVEDNPIPYWELILASVIEESENLLQRKDRLCNVIQEVQPF
ncbi:hypothetical protein H1S01_07280 [Heliobacterium chlorum]|uniref:Uncharacterized protein n=1 Tax=Heliobacterium chlorum TaxID=2698 RepID=A0ABR7T2F9_HELCL|nr:hypothetical protein [Heliobacterium chlorum]MBC9784312.1 hypothetical protein [Heliobacterium chlorum]